jgi:hypothetical protein
MMLYRGQPGPSPIWLVVGAALTSLLGFLAGRLSAPQPSVQELLQPAALHLRQAEGANAQSQTASRRALEQIQIEEQVQIELGGARTLRQLFPQERSKADGDLAAASAAFQNPCSPERPERPRVPLSRNERAGPGAMLFPAPPH